jgi:hypothetical protein
MFLEEPRGTVQLADREIAVRALRTRDKRVRDAVDRACMEKHNTPVVAAHAGASSRGSGRAVLRSLIPTPRAPPRDSSAERLKFSVRELAPGSIRGEYS